MVPDGGGVASVESPYPVAGLNRQSASLSSDLQKNQSAVLDSTHQALSFLSSLYEPNDWICLTFIHCTKKTNAGASVVENFFLPLSDAISNAAIARMQARSKAGWNLYVAMNPMAPGAIRRKKEFAGPPKNIFAEVDEDGDTVLDTVRASAASGEIPPPSVITQSSPGKYQFVWRINTDEFTLEKVEIFNKALISKFGADPACSDQLRVFRLPGFANSKYDAHPIVQIVEMNEGRSSVADFQIPMGEEKSRVVKPPASDNELVAIVDYFENAAKEANLRLSQLKKWGDSGYLWEITCLWVHEHTGQKDSGTVVLLHKSGALDFVCQHGHCKERTWPLDFRPKLEELVGHSLRFGDPAGGVIFNSTPAGVPAQPAPPCQPAEGPHESNKSQARKTAIGREMVMSRADKFDAEVIPWLWPNRIVANNVNVFSGEPDQGKSLCWTDLVARVTTGRDFPDCSNDLGGPVDVVVMASEDDIGSTIIPRLIAAESDLTRVHFAVVTENVSGTISEGVAALDRDLPTLNTLLEQLKQTGVSVALIVVDPIIAFIGDADPNKDKEVRPIFTRMKSFSKKNGLAWLTVNHLNKNSNATSINRTSGAKSFVSAPRASWMFAADPDNPERRLMMKGKGNLVKQGLKTLAYRIVETFIQVKGKPFLDSKLRPVGVPRIQWDGESEHIADDVLQSAADPTSKRSLKAEELIQKLFNQSPMGVVLASDVYNAGECESPSIPADKLRRAKTKVKVEVFRFLERWYWAKSATEMQAFKASGGLQFSKT